MTDDNDFMERLAAEAEEAPRQNAPTEDSLAALGKLAAEVREIDEEVATAEGALAALKIRRYAILTRDMIDIMDAAGIEDFSSENDKFVAETKYHASIPKESAEEAHKWLDNDGSGDIVKRTVSIAFPKESQAQAEELARYARERYQNTTVDVKLEVPWKRLTSWFKEQIEELSRTDIPTTLLGAKMERVVSLKPKKK